MKKHLIAIASAFLVSGAYAQTASSTAVIPASTTAEKAPAATDAIETHIKDLHAKLRISMTEEAQWTTVANAMRDNAMELDGAIAKREALKSATAVEDLTAYGDIAQAHADGVKKLATAFAPLYSAMSADQKKTADEMFAQRSPADKKKAMAAK